MRKTTNQNRCHQSTQGIQTLFQEKRRNIYIPHLCKSSEQQTQHYLLWKGRKWEFDLLLLGEIFFPQAFDTTKKGIKIDIAVPVFWRDGKN